MGLLTHRVKRSELAAGDHIYTWRTLFAYSHHGIYVGGSKVVHFTPQYIVPEDPIIFSAPSKCSSASNINVSSSKNRSALSKNVSSNVPVSRKNVSWSKNVSASTANVSSTCTIPDCGFQRKDSGVVLSCLDCFLDGGGLYHFEYGVSMSFFLGRVRGGTCTTAQSDPPEEVIHRAMYLLKNGFRNYDALTNNCEDFALYCKTGLLNHEAGSSGQTASAFGAPLAAVITAPLKLFMSSPAVSVLAAGFYCFTRYAADLDAGSDVVTKVKVEELTSFLNRKGSKQSIHVVLRQKAARL